MKYFITITLACLITACQTTDAWTGHWYSPNGLVKVDLNKDNSYCLHHIEGTERGTWLKQSNTILLSDSSILQIDSTNLVLDGNKLSKEKPKTSVPLNANLTGLNFIWTFESDGVQIDTVSFSNNSYYSSFNKRSHQYKLIPFNGLLYFTHDNLSNIGNRYFLVHTLNKKELIFDFYDYGTKKHIKTVLRQL